ncbi:MAG TPA: hypothetical protein VGN22_01000 [Pseudonocardia sp.]
MGAPGHPDDHGVVNDERCDSGVATGPVVPDAGWRPQQWRGGGGGSSWALPGEGRWVR